VLCSDAPVTRVSVPDRSCFVQVHASHLLVLPPLAVAGPKEEGGKTPLAAVDRTAAGWPGWRRGLEEPEKTSLWLRFLTHEGCVFVGKNN